MSRKRVFSLGGFVLTFLVFSLGLRPMPAVAVVATGYRVMSFNVLGSSHTGGKGKRPGMAPGPERVPGVVRILNEGGADVVGFQEFQRDQFDAFKRQTEGWGFCVGDTTENAIAWRQSSFTFVRCDAVPIPYFGGHIRLMPYVLLRQTAAPYREVYVANFHNPADVGGNMQRWRNEAAVREVALADRLDATGAAVIVTGDMNEREEYYCKLAANAAMFAAVGGSSPRGGSCSPPDYGGIDWIFGSRKVYFSDWSVRRDALVERTTDHPVVSAEFHLASTAEAGGRR